MSANGSDPLTPKPKRTVLVPDRNHTSSQDGLLPMRRVSVSAAPWEMEQALDELGVREPAPKEKQIIRKGARPGKLPPDKGRFYKPNEEPEF